MSTRTKLIKNNDTLDKTNLKLMAIKNAFMRPLPQYTGSSTPTSGTDTSDATATQSDIAQGKTAYVKGTKLIGTHVCSTPETQEKTATPTTSTQTITPDSGKYLSKVTVNPIPSNYIVPSGNKAITKNGTHDVTNYATVSINVASSGSTSLDAITTLPKANKYNVGCYCNVNNTTYKCVQASGSNLLGYTDTLIGKTIKLDIEALRTDGKLYEGGTSTATSNVYIDLVNANGSTYDAIRIQIKLKNVNGVNQIEEIYYLYYPGNTGYRYHWYCYGKTSADNTTTYKYFDDNTITFTTDNVQILNDYGFIKSDYRSNEWLEYLTIGDVIYNWVAQ